MLYKRCPDGRISSACEAALILAFCAIGVWRSQSKAQNHRCSCTAVDDDRGRASGASPVPKPEPLSATTGGQHALPERTQHSSPDCEAQLDAFNGKPCDIIFIGDSITAGWLSAGKRHLGPRNIRAAAMRSISAISGDKTQNVLWRLNNMSLQNLKPKVAVVLIGTNNVDNTPHEIADGVKAVLANTQTDLLQREDYPRQHHAQSIAQRRK